MKTPEGSDTAAAAPLWQDGWYRFARAMASPNFGPRPDGALIDLIVIHSISLPPGDFGNGNVQRLFTNQLDWDAHPYFEGIRGLQVSSHFFIARSGALWQFVGCGDRAWHAGQSSYRGRSNCNDDSIGIELEWRSTKHLPACAPRCLRLIRSPTLPATSISPQAASRIRGRVSIGRAFSRRWVCPVSIFPKSFSCLEKHYRQNNAGSRKQSGLGTRQKSGCKPLWTGAHWQRQRRCRAHQNLICPAKVQ
jgi:hypothetical protein